jgi:hypothetical protein
MVRDLASDFRRYVSDIGLAELGRPPLLASLARRLSWASRWTGDLRGVCDEHRRHSDSEEVPDPRRI